MHPVTEYDHGLKEGVLLELGSRGGTYPAGRHEYRSMVADYALTELGETDDTRPVPPRMPPPMCLPGVGTQHG